LPRSTVQERFKHSILKRWWKTYNFDKHLDYKEEGTVNDGIMISYNEFKNKYILTSSDINIIVIKKSTRKILHKIFHTKSIFCQHSEYLLIVSQYTNISQKRDARNIKIHIEKWINSIKDALSSEHFVLTNLWLNKNLKTIHEYQTVNDVWLANKRKCSGQRKLLILVDLPGIGDAIRLICLLPELRKKYKQFHIVLVTNMKSYVIYQRTCCVDEIFCCTIRPDPPLVPHMTPSLLSDFLITGKHEKVISLAWDLSAYLLNKKYNFIDIYAKIAGVDKISKPKLFIDINKQILLQKLNYNYNIKKNDFIIGLQLKASMESKSWSNHRINEFTSALLLKIPNAKILNLDYRDIENKGIINIGNSLDIETLILEIQKCNLFIGVDSGGGHIAAMFDIPTITIYGKEKPRIGNDHRPLSPFNISIEPPLNCECAEYDIVCPKPPKCIDSITPFIVYMAIDFYTYIHNWKNVMLGEKIILHKFNKSAIVSDWCKKTVFDKGLEIDIINQCGTNTHLISLNKEICIDKYSILGIDLYVKKNAFLISSYSMLGVKIITSGKNIILDMHRIHEGWNLTYFHLPKTSSNLKTITFSLFLNLNKEIKNNICIKELYLVKRNDG
jgi:ADP-heptose:LPS heptosyltransferase